MEYLTLNNGVRMPMLGYGTWDVRGAAGRRCIREALEVGYRLLDTARMYENEDIVGQAVRESGLPREDVFITTKLYRPSAGYEKARRDIEGSLRALGTDYIDLLLIHEPYDTAEEMYVALEEAYQAGTLRAIGISNFHEARYQTFLTGCQVVPMVNQVESHVYFLRKDLQRAMAAHGTVTQAWAPFTEGRRDLFSEPALQEIGAAHGKTAAQTALRYLIQNGIGVIPKSSHRARMEENFALFDFALTAAEMERIGRMNEGASLFGWY